MEQRVYSGFVQERYADEKDDVLFFSKCDSPIADEFERRLNGKQVSIRYWTSNTERTKEQIQEDALKALVGSVYATYGACYSEVTGYLWTDEKLTIGGHNLINELRSYIGKYIYMEIDIHQ